MYLFLVTLWDVAVTQVDTSLQVLLLIHGHHVGRGCQHGDTGNFYVVEVVKRLILTGDTSLQTHVVMVAVLMRVLGYLSCWLP